MESYEVNRPARCTGCAHGWVISVAAPGLHRSPDVAARIQEPSDGGSEIVGIAFAQRVCGGGAEPARTHNSSAAPHAVLELDRLNRPHSMRGAYYPFASLI
jgi:hypothetical protein